MKLCFPSDLGLLFRLRVSLRARVRLMVPYERECG